MISEHEREIDAVIAAFYGWFESSSAQRAQDDDQRRSHPEERSDEGPLGRRGDLEALFAKDAQVTRVSAAIAETWTVDEFIAPRLKMLTDGTLTNFHEWECESDTTVLGAIASRTSLYRKEGTLHGAPYSGEGRKFIQLARVDGRWLIVSVLWQDL